MNAEMDRNDEFAAFDDLLSGALIDNLFPPHPAYRARKVAGAARRNSTRCVKEYLSIVRLARDGKISSASDKLVKCLSRFLPRTILPTGNSSVSASVLRRFKRFCGSYLSVFHRDAGCEIVQTTRYQSNASNRISDQESAGYCDMTVIALHHFSSGDYLRWLTGQLSRLSVERSNELCSKGADFSVIYTARSGRYNLFLGPARFVNHDCNPNCEFISLGGSSVSFRTLRSIEPGEELTVSYGENYFGPQNRECLCESCQTRPSKPVDDKTASDMATESIEDETARQRSRHRVDDRKANLKFFSPRPISTSKCFHPNHQNDYPRVQCGYCRRHRMLYGTEWPLR